MLKKESFLLLSYKLKQSHCSFEELNEPIQVRIKVLFTVFKPEPRFISFLLAAMVNRSYTEFIWFVFPVLSVYLLGLGGEAGWGRDRGTGPFPHLPCHVELVLWSREFFRHCRRWFIDVFPASSCFIESTYFVISVTFSQLALNSSIQLGDFLAALRPQFPWGWGVVGTLASHTSTSPHPSSRGACFFRLADVEFL